MWMVGAGRGQLSLALSCYRWHIMHSESDIHSPGTLSRERRRIMAPIELNTQLFFNTRADRANRMGLTSHGVYGKERDWLASYGPCDHILNYFQICMVSEKSLPKYLFLGSCRRMHFSEKRGGSQALKSGSQALERVLGNSQDDNERKTIKWAA